MLKAALEGSDASLDVEIVPIKSKADWKKSEGEKPLSEENGGKGLFAKEIETALSNGDIDCGVHSLKDMASFLPDGLVIEHCLPRADARDAMISAIFIKEPQAGKPATASIKEPQAGKSVTAYNTIDDLPQGATLGTCSARRKAMAMAMRPDLNVVPFRGNVQTRIDKIKVGQVGATFLAMAGLTRLGIMDSVIHPIATDVMLPACGQGIVCMEMRDGDVATKAVLDKVNCIPTSLSAIAEREVLRALDGSCHTPIAAFAVVEDGQMYLRAEVYALDGSSVYKEELRDVCANKDDALKIGQTVGEKINAQLPEGFLA